MRRALEFYQRDCTTTVAVLQGQQSNTVPATADKLVVCCTRVLPVLYCTVQLVTVRWAKVKEDWTFSAQVPMRRCQERFSYLAKQ